MTRVDVALLAFRTMALWLGASALSALVAVPWMGPSERAALDAFAVTIGAIPVLVAVAIWLIAPAAARATFGGSTDPVRFELAPDGIPPLALFVVGLLLCAQAVPDAAWWLVARVLHRTDGLMTEWEAQPVADAAAVAARLILGVTLIVLSRRRTLWAPPDAEADGR
jgi:hypothetical protein